MKNADSKPKPSHFPFMGGNCLFIFVLINISKLYGKICIGDLVILYVIVGAALVILLVIAGETLVLFSFSSSFRV